MSLMSLAGMFGGGGGGGGSGSGTGAPSGPQINPPDASSYATPYQGGFWSQLGDAAMRSKQAGGGLAGLGAALSPNSGAPQSQGVSYMGGAYAPGTAPSSMPMGGMTFGAGGAPGSAQAMGQTMNKLGSL